MCKSSRSFDLGPKLALYQRAGVLEYTAVLIEEQRVEWRYLEQGSYRVGKAVNGVLKSAAFPGLWLDEDAFWAGDGNRMLATLDTGLQSPECGQFLERIGRK